MTAGGDSFIHSMMSLAGLDNVFGMQERYPEVTLDDIRDSGCEVVLLSSEPYPFGPKHATELAGELPGVAVILVDGEVFSWYGSRMLHAPAFFHKMWQNIESYVADTQIPDPSLFLQKPKK
jgi:ABC-type Fe3+-hydroxamate transport system substrate-binding protein